MRTTSVRVLAPLLALALAATACGDDDDPTTEGTPTPSGSASAPSSEETPQGGTLRVLAEDEIGDFDTAPAYDTYSYHVLRATDRQLYTNASGDADTRAPLVPDLAEGDPEISEDGLTYTFTLKDGVQWNAEPARQITSDDMIRGLEFLCNPDAPFGGRKYFDDLVMGFTEFCEGFSAVEPDDPAASKAYVEANDISGVTKIDEMSFSVTLTAPAADFLRIIALPAASPRPIEALAYSVDSQAYRENKIESGPYQIESYTPDAELVLSRNPAWDADTDPVREANVDQIEITFGVDPAVIQERIEGGTADLALANTSIPAAALSQIEDDDPLLESNATGAIAPYLMFNLTEGGNPALQKLEVRQALNYAVSKRKVIQDFGGSRAAKPHTQIFPSTAIGAGFEPQDLYPTPDSNGDPDKATTMLAAAGEEGLTLTLATVDAGNFKATATTIQEDLKLSGVNLELNFVPGPDYGAYLSSSEAAENGEWDLLMGGWGPDWEGNAERAYFTPLLDGRAEGSSNVGGYNNDEVNAAADAALASENAADQWNAIDTLIMQDAPWIPLIEQIQLNYRAERLGGFAYYFPAANGDLTSYFIKDES